MRNTFVKAICLALTAVLVLTFVSCGSKSEDETTLTAQESTQPEESSTELMTEAVTVDETSTLSDETLTEVQQTEQSAVAQSEVQDTKPSTKAEIVEYFNSAINKVKPGAKSITQNYELNTQIKDLDLSSLKMLQSLANSLIDSNMGYKKEANNRLMTSLADKNAYFAVEGKDWSSKLTANDVESAALTEKDGVYTITLNLKDEPASDSTTKGTGHVGKAMSVVEVSKIYENAGGAKNIIKNVMTGNPDAKIVVTVDKATGNVTHANYYMPWELALTAMGIDVTVTFGIEQDYDIKW